MTGLSLVDAVVGTHPQWADRRRRHTPCLLGLGRGAHLRGCTGSLGTGPAAARCRPLLDRVLRVRPGRLAKRQQSVVGILGCCFGSGIACDIDRCGHFELVCAAAEQALHRRVETHQR